jgi:hypothetical protein
VTLVLTISISLEWAILSGLAFYFLGKLVWGKIR